MKVKIFGKRKNDRLNEDRLDELQKRLEKFIPTHDNVSRRFIAPADIMKDYAKRVHMLCVFESLVNDEIDKNTRDIIVRSCAFCLFGMSVLMSELGRPFSDVVSELERKIKETENEEGRGRED